MTKIELKTELLNYLVNEKKVGNEKISIVALDSIVDFIHEKLDNKTLLLINLEKK